MSDRSPSNDRTNSGSRAGAGAGLKLGVLLVCFDTMRAADATRRRLDERLRSGGDALLDTVVLRVDAKHRSSVHDPRRVVQGTLTAALTWGLFGLVAGGLESLAIWAILGAVCGGVFAYVSEHLVSKDDLAEVGRRLPASSSALLIFAETADPQGLLRAAAAHGPAAASVAGIGDDLSARVFAGAADPVEVAHSTALGSHPPGPNAPVSMILVRYPDPDTARQLASRTASSAKAAGSDFVPIELVIWVDRNGRRHVADPSQGMRAWAKSDLISWGAFGVVVGALVGIFGGGGLLGPVGDAVLTGFAWAVFGLFAGALYGLWAGRAVSARRLKGLHGLLRSGSSLLVAWGDARSRQVTLDRLTTSTAQRLILRFNPVDRGALLEPSKTLGEGGIP